MPAQARDPLFDLLRPARLTAIVDIGANPIDGDPPYKDMLASGLCTVTGFEPQPHALAELNRRKGPHEQYLPDAVGNGREHTLYVCQEPGMTSLFPPDPDQLALFSDFPRHGAVREKRRVSTRRLDDISEVTAIDLLKIDIQGGELDVFESGRRALAKAVAIQTEVSFISLYRDQPTFGAIDSCLRGMGFVPHCFFELKVRPLAPLVFDRDPSRGVRQLLEADVVYVRDFAHADTMDGEQWKHLALIAHHCYDSMDLAFRAMDCASRLGAVDVGAVQQYLRLLQSLGVPVAASR
jgi:FkbM family methyltransferase